MCNNVTKIPESYKRAVDKELQGTITETTYSVKNYINPSRKFVTDQNLSSEEVGREIATGDAIHKKCKIYLPAGYDEKDENVKYDILYLLHGGGGNCDEWLSDNGVIDGNYIICNILDNLIANGDIKPLIVVFPEGRSAHNWTDRSFNFEGEHILGFYYFDYELRYDLMPFIESKYKTLANINNKSEEAIEFSRNHRAIAGLSMGGMQALNLTLGGFRCDSTTYTGTTSPWQNSLDITVQAPGMLDLFAYVGAFSNAPTSSQGQVLGKGIAESDHELNLLYITCGDADLVAYYPGFKQAVEQLLETAGDKLIHYYNVIIKDGYHDFDVWNNGAYNFIRLTFGEGQEYNEKSYKNIWLN